jgi:hypothetical protein
MFLETQGCYIKIVYLHKIFSSLRSLLDLPPLSIVLGQKGHGQSVILYS